MDWSQLRSEFEQLQEPLRFTRLDYQWGAAGVYYRLAGGAGSNAARQFELLAQSAGRKLGELPAGVDGDDIPSAANPEENWYEALRQYSGAFEFGFTGTQVDDEGNNCGNIYSGTVNTPAEASALVCLRFLTTPVLQAPAEPTKHRRFRRVNEFLAREAEHRGHLWLVVAFVVATILAVLALL